MKEAHSKKVSYFLLGYTGCHNTGSDVRILTIIDDLCDCFGDKISITVASFHPENTAKIIKENHQIKIAHVPFIFPLKILQLVTRHDVTVLVEGSCFKQNWGNVLLYLFLWGAMWAKLAGKKCVAYAVDVGELSPFNAFVTRKICDKLDLLITRTQFAKTRLIKMGVRNQIFANTDTAFRFLSNEKSSSEDFKLSSREVVGIAPIEFYQFPLKTKLFGKKDECYNYPYYYTWDDTRREKSKRLIEAYRKLIEHSIEDHNLDVMLIAMEALDTGICDKILNGIGEVHKSRIRFVSAKDLTPFQMIPTLRNLKFLVTARYHACVLSMRSAVPQMAICHDERLESIYTELGMEKDYLLHFEDPLLPQKIIPMFDYLVERGDALKGVLEHKHKYYFLPKCAQNKADMKAWAERT